MRPSSPFKARIAARTKTLLETLLALAMLIAPLASGNPARHLIAGWHRWSAPQPQPAMEDFLQQVDRRLEADVELALWWSRRGPDQASYMGHWWATTSYRLAPRRVYPLLTVEEMGRLPTLAPDLRAFLTQRSLALTEGRPTVPTAVASWGPPTPCRIPLLPDATPIFEAYVGCLSLPAGVQPGPAVDRAP